MLQCAVMTDDNVQKNPQCVGWNWRFLRGRRSHGLQPNRAAHNMSNQIAVCGVGETALPFQLDCLAQIMQKQTKQDKVAVQAGIQRQHDIRKQHELQRVLKQTADVRVMHADRGGRASKMLRDVFVGKVLLGQCAHAWMLQGVKQSLDLLHH